MSEQSLKKISYLLITTLFGLSIFTIPSPQKAIAGLGVPFGGAIIEIFPGCTAPAGIALKIGPPTPMPLMYIPGKSLSFLYGPPAHPGQWLLGLAHKYSPCLIACPAGVCPYASIPGGLVIWFHGSSP